MLWIVAKCPPKIISEALQNVTFEIREKGNNKEFDDKFEAERLRAVLISIEGEQKMLIESSPMSCQSHLRNNVHRFHHYPLTRLSLFVHSIKENRKLA